MRLQSVESRAGAGPMVAVRAPNGARTALLAAAVLVAGTAIGTEVLDRSWGKLVAYHGSVCACVTRDRINSMNYVHRAQPPECAPSDTRTI